MVYPKRDLNAYLDLKDMETINVSSIARDAISSGVGAPLGASWPAQGYERTTDAARADSEEGWELDPDYGPEGRDPKSGYRHWRRYYRFHANSG